MGLFRAKPAPAFGVSNIKAAAGRSVLPSTLSNNVVGAKAERALSIPTITRAVGLISSTIASLNLRSYTLKWNPTTSEYDKNYVLGESWFTRPDPKVTRQFVISNLVSDLLLYGRAFLYTSSRYVTGFPATFQWLPANTVTSTDQGDVWFTTASDLFYNGVELDTDNVVQFLSPQEGILYAGNNAIDTAHKLDESARRFASNSIAAGYLQQTDGEPMSGEELTELASAWAQARNVNAIGALNQHVTFNEFKSNPNLLQLLESRQFASLELARLCQVPAYLVGVAVGSMTYQNAQQARQDLLTFGASPFLTCIAETLSGDNVIQHGKHIEFDTDAYLSTFSLDAGDSSGRSLSAAEVAQKVYLAVTNGIMTEREAREMINEAGGNLT